MIRDAARVAGHPGGHRRGLRGRRRAGHAGHRGPGPRPSGDHRHRRPRLLPAGRGPLRPGALQPAGSERLRPLRRGRASRSGPGCAPSSTRSWPPCGAIPPTTCPACPGVGEKTAAKLVNEYGDLDTLYAHLDALSPKLRENLAAHLERVRKNAEVIPLVRDVPLDVHIDQLVLGGWDLEEAHQVFAELELRQLWTRFTTLMAEGAFGEPAPGSSLPRRGGGDAGSEGRPSPTAGTSRRGCPDPRPSVPLDAAGGRRGGRRPGGRRPGRRPVAVALHARWSGDPGRSPLASLTLAAEPGRRRGGTPAGGPSRPSPARGAGSRSSRIPAVLGRAGRRVSGRTAWRWWPTTPRR